MREGRAIMAAHKRGGGLRSKTAKAPQEGPKGKGGRAKRATKAIKTGTRVGGALRPPPSPPGAVTGRGKSSQQTS